VVLILLFIFVFKMKKIFTIIFCCLIAFPLFQSLTGLFSDMRIEEKRDLAEISELSLSEQGFDQTTAYFNDHFGFRGSLIFLNNYLDLKIFKISPNPQVVMGKDDWMYYAPSYESNRFAVGQSEVESIAKKIYDFQKAVEADGKKFVFVLAPNKESIYSEYLREELFGKNNYSVIMNALKQHEVNTFDALDVLQKAKMKGDFVYSKNDTHWTRYGLLLAINEMLKVFGRTEIVFTGLEDTKRIGDLSLLIGFDNFETVPQPVIDDKSVVKTDRVLIFHDSFFDNEMYFTLLFDNFKKIHWAAGNIRQEYDELKRDYDVVILEIAERDFVKLDF